MLGRLSVLSCAVVGLGGTPGFASRTTFDPTISFGWGYTNNVEYVATDYDRVSDSVGTLGVTLPVHHQLRNGSLGMTYSTGVTKYQESTDYNYDAHRFSLNFDSGLGRRSTFNADANYVFSQDQGGADQRIGDEVTLVGRSEWRAIDLNLGLDRQLGRRWSWSVGVGGSTSEVTAISTSPGGPPVEGREGYRFSLGASGGLGKKSSFGFSYGYSFTELDSGIGEDTHSLGLSYDRRLGKHSDCSAWVGGYHRSQQESASAPEPVDYIASGVELQFRMSYNPPQALHYSLGVGLRPSSGGLVVGTSTDLNVGFDVGSAIERTYWSWSTGIGYTRRAPSDSSLPTLQTFALHGSVERRVAQSVGLRFGLNAADQSSGNAADAASQVSYYSAGAHFVWYPLERRR